MTDSRKPAVWMSLFQYQRFQALAESDAAKAGIMEIAVQSQVASVLEAVANTVVGIVLGQAILYYFGIRGGEAWEITGAFIVMSLIRSYALRRLFDYLG